MNRVLILTVTAGNGHNAVANSIKNKLLNLGKEVLVVDTFCEYKKKFKQLMVNNGYLLASNVIPHVFNMFFEAYSCVNPEKRNIGPTQDFIKSVTPHILKTIYEFKPDVIICTHFYPAIIITNLRKAYPINAKVVSILTDYVVHPFWESAIGVDYIITPCEEVTETLIFKGYSKTQIKCFGFPIEEKFNTKQTKADARNVLSLKDNVLTICVTCGGFGSAKMPEIIKKLIKLNFPLQIISISGKNKLSYKKIKNQIDSGKFNNLNKTILNYSFTNEIDLIFSASDIMISKGGCGFINEAMKKCLPQIFIRDLPSQEIYNAEYMKKHNAAIVATKQFDIDKIIAKIYNNPAIINDLIKNIKKIRKVNALLDITNFVTKFGAVNYVKDIKIVKSKVNSKIREATKIEKSINKPNFKKSSYKTYVKIKRIKKLCKYKQNKLYAKIYKKVS